MYICSHKNTSCRQSCAKQQGPIGGWLVQRYICCSQLRLFLWKAVSQPRSNLPRSGQTQQKQNKPVLFFCCCFLNITEAWLCRFIGDRKSPEGFRIMVKKKKGDKVQLLQYAVYWPPLWVGAHTLLHYIISKLLLLEFRKINISITDQWTLYEHGVSLTAAETTGASVTTRKRSRPGIIFLRWITLYSSKAVRVRLKKSFTVSFVI